MYTSAGSESCYSCNSFNKVSLGDVKLSSPRCTMEYSGLVHRPPTRICITCSVQLQVFSLVSAAKALATCGGSLPATSCSQASFSIIASKDDTFGNAGKKMAESGDSRPHRSVLAAIVLELALHWSLPVPCIGAKHTVPCSSALHQTWHRT